MSERKRSPRTRVESKAGSDLAALTRRVLLAGVGAAALAYDEARAFVDRLVERGAMAEEQGRALLQEVAEKRKGQIEAARGRVKARLDRTLGVLDVPTRGDLEALQQRLDRLTERLEALLKERAG